MASNPSERKVTCPKCGEENLSWRSRCEKCGEDLHKNEVKVPKFEGYGAGFWIAFGASAISIVFFSVIAFLAPGFSGYYANSTVGMTLMFAFPVLGLALCWKWQKTAGAALIIGGILQTALILTSGKSILSFLFFGIALPLISSGVMFLIIRRR